MSGFLIWWSIGRSTSFQQYLKKRFWRIYPELWLAVLIELIVLLVLYREPINWKQFFLFSITQSTIFQFWTPDCLRGYGCGCPNGSLWTICVLVQFYFFAYFIYKALHGRKNYIWVLSISLSIAIGCLTPLVYSFLPEIGGKLYSQTLFPYLWMFIIPSYVAEKKENLLPYLKKYWFIFVVFTIALKYSQLDIKAGYYLLHTCTLFFGLVGASYIFPHFNIKTDISYGVYIYHMTIVNALIELNYTNNYLYLIFVAISTLVLAWISTMTVGRWSLNKKKVL